MAASYLEHITLHLPPTGAVFTAELAALLSPLGAAQGHGLAFTGSDPGFFPKVSVQFYPGAPAVWAEFAFSEGAPLRVDIENITGRSQPSPHAYQPLPIETVRRRLADAAMTVKGIDHAGFNLPWFGPGLHPRLVQLRAQLAARCLYHTFPTGEPWDFIIPGRPGEIARAQPVDYARVRKPKFELVSFDKASTPLIQFDLGVEAPYARFAPLFPEALADPQYHNSWIYLDTPYPVDICLVLNALTGDDWSGFFSAHRL